MNAMKIWRRLAPRSKGHISLIIVSSDAMKVRELRLTRFWYRVFAGILGVGLIMLVMLGVYYASLGRVLAAGVAKKQPLEVQLAEANRKTQALAQELAEMKEVAERIRHLAGVEEFEATAPPSAAEYTPGYADAASDVETALALGETRLPFLLRDRWASLEEGDLKTRQKTLLRSTPFVWPVRGWVTREFQNADDPISRPHPGMDIAAREGTPVMAAGDGMVSYADWDQDLGWLVVVEHGYGFTTRYGHNASLRVEKGNRIQRGQIIALVGNTGRSSAPHLHYEVWKDQVPVDPRSYLPAVIPWDDLQRAGGFSG
jgi:murein DD-endopeptidase MepM/ murein hydrolase activator NlpD